MNSVAGETNSVARETNSVAGETNFKSVSWTWFLCEKVSLRGFRKYTFMPSFPIVQEIEQLSQKITILLNSNRFPQPQEGKCYSNGLVSPIFLSGFSEISLKMSQMSLE